MGGRGEAETAADELIAGPEDAGLRLDAFLAAREAATSRAAAQRLIERGDVTSDGVARPKNHRLHDGAHQAATEAVLVDVADHRLDPYAAADRLLAILHEGAG